MRALVAVVVVVAGCSVDVGAGSIAPLAIDAPIDATRWRPPLSLAMDIAFLSAEQSNAIADQYGDKLGAVDAIDVEVEGLAVTATTRGAKVSAGVLVIRFEGLTIDRVGQRVRLPDDVKQRVLAAVAARAALTLSVTATVTWHEPAPATITAHALLQPIIVVDGLKAL